MVMAAGYTSCPYCNAQLPPGDAANGRRPFCPRCGEALPSRGLHLDGEGPAPLAPPPVVPEAPRQWSNRSVAATVLAVMATMGVIGLVLALGTVSFRRSKDPQPEADPYTSAPVRHVAPLELTALRWLPADTNVVAGIHVAELWTDPRGKEFLNTLRPGAGDLTFANLEQWTGLKPEEIDHLVLGVKVDDRLPPRLNLVLETRRPYDAQKVLSALKIDDRPPEKDGKRVYRFRLEKSSAYNALWLAGPLTLIVGLTAADLDAVSPVPEGNPEHLPAPLRALLRERVSAEAPAWIVAHADRWRDTILGPLLLLLPKKDQAVLSKVKTVSLWWRWMPEPSVSLAVRCTDAEAAKALNAYLNEQLRQPKSPVRQLFTNPEAKPFADDLARSWQFEQDGPWLTATPAKPKAGGHGPPATDH